MHSLIRLMVDLEVGPRSNQPMFAVSLNSQFEFIYRFYIAVDQNEKKNMFLLLILKGIKIQKLNTIRMFN